MQQFYCHNIDRSFSLRYFDTCVRCLIVTLRFDKNDDFQGTNGHGNRSHKCTVFRRPLQIHHRENFAFTIRDFVRYSKGACMDFSSCLIVFTLSAVKTSMILYHVISSPNTLLFYPSKLTPNDYLARSCWTVMTAGTI